jgi:uncharacterized lipoprotein YddW (UPF0748 family)
LSTTKTKFRKIFLFIIPFLIFMIGVQARAEVRAIFDEGTGWITPSGAFETIRRIKRGGFYVYVPCVWHGRGTRYNSKVAPAEHGLKSIVAKADPLTRLVKIAHDNGIEVHPWFCVTLRQRDFLSIFYDPTETPQKAFDIHRPDFQQFIVDLISDVIKRYDIDGINLDYIRSMGVCTCPHCQRQYRETYNRSLRKDIARSGNMVRLAPPLQKWQDSAVETIVQRVSREARQLKPSLVLSICGNPRLPSEPVNPQGRQEIKWANAGLIDLIYCMNYKSRPLFDRHESIRRLVKKPAKAIILIGNFDRDESHRVWPRDPRTLAALIAETRERWDDGFGLYLYSQFSDQQLNAIRELGFAE